MNSKLRFPGKILLFIRRILFALLLCNAAASILAQTPDWIWHANTNAQSVFFRKSFRTPPLLWNARLTVSADDSAEVFLNGVSVARCTDYKNPIRSEVSVRLNQGENVIAIHGENKSGNAGLLVHFNLNGQTNLISDSSWLASTNEEAGWNTLNFNSAQWQHASAIGPHGILPWGDVLVKAAATAPESLTVPADFKVELLRSAQAGEGSWICMTFDPKGRLIISPEGDAHPLLRITMKDRAVSQVEPVPAPIHYAMGLLYAFDSLYVSAHGPKGAGLYRLIDRNNNDQFDPDEVQLLKNFEGGSEHGYHALALGPDKKIYVLNGNGTKLPTGVSPRSPLRNYAEDMLSLPTRESNDQDGARPPASYILRTDAEGKDWELFAGGMRNAYDFDFNPEGELFAFDSDMEWDWGTPWYRATRIVHCVSGAEFGWRDGTRVWPDYYFDSLPPVVYVGIGSPTGVKFGTKSNFPAKYREALFAMDWSYGRIVTVHLKAGGSSYTGQWETFLQGKPLNLTSLNFGPDGAMYFITGGRGTQSGLYRVSYNGKERAVAKTAVDAKALESRNLRHQLEALHGREDRKAVDFLWPFLSSKDRFLQFAARVALESQKVENWKSQALLERKPDASLAALLALVRSTGREMQNEILSALFQLGFDRLSEPQKLEKLRVLELSLIREGKPSSEMVNRIFLELNREFPASSWPLNRELSRILLFLGRPHTIPEMVVLLDTAPAVEEQMHYVEQLRNAREGWSMEDRKLFFSWWQKPRSSKEHPPELLKYFQDVGRSYVDGAWFDRYLRDFRRDAIATLSPEEKSELTSLLNTPLKGSLQVPFRTRNFVREWKMEDFASELGQQSPRNVERGRQAFVDTQCLMCHRFGNDGGVVGPELTAAGSKYSARDILESILEPSKVISDQYGNSIATLKDGDSITGRLVSQNDEEVVIETDRLNGTQEKIPRKNVTELKPSPISPMPDDLVNVLSKEEVLDLVAYIRAGSPASQ